MNQPLSSKPEGLDHQVTRKEVATALVKFLGLHDGHFELSFEFKIAIGQVGPGGGETMPGAALGISSMGLIRHAEANPHTVDASKINPARKTSRSKTASA